MGAAIGAFIVSYVAPELAASFAAPSIFGVVSINALIGAAVIVGAEVGISDALAPSAAAENAGQGIISA